MSAVEAAMSKKLALDEIDTAWSDDGHCVTGNDIVGLVDNAAGDSGEDNRIDLNDKNESESDVCINNDVDMTDNDILSLAHSIDNSLDMIKNEICVSHADNISITINRDGPLLISLCLFHHPCPTNSFSCPVILSFDVDELTQESGEIEKHGDIQVGDALVQINGKCCCNMSLDSVFELLKELGGQYRKLVFMKASKLPTVADGDEGKSISDSTSKHSMLDVYHTLSNVLSNSSIFNSQDGYDLDTHIAPHPSSANNAMHQISTTLSNYSNIFRKNRSDTGLSNQSIHSNNSKITLYDVHEMCIKADIIEIDKGVVSKDDGKEHKLSGVINIPKLKFVTNNGVSDSVRFVFWATLLGCLSIAEDDVEKEVNTVRTCDHWFEELASNCALYETFRNELVIMQNTSESQNAPDHDVVTETSNVNPTTNGTSSCGQIASCITVRPPTVELYMGDSGGNDADGDVSMESLDHESIMKILESIRHPPTSSSPESDMIDESCDPHVTNPTHTRPIVNMPQPVVDPRWTDYYNDISLVDTIARDVARTNPHIKFFTINSLNNNPCGVGPDIHSNIGTDMLNMNPLATNMHLQAIERILFIHAKLNKALKYVQGMSDICGIFYYVVATSPIEIVRNSAEQHCYHLFARFMSEMQDLFLQEMDDSVFGIYAKVKEFDELLLRVDNELHAYLVDELGIEAHLYSFRWFTTLFCREFVTPDVIRIWDSLFADDERNTLVLYFAVAMVYLIKDQLYAGDFTENLTVLQSYPTNIDVDLIIETAHSMRNRVNRGRAKKRKSFTELISLAASAINHSGSNVECDAPAVAAADNKSLEGSTTATPNTISNTQPNAKATPPPSKNLTSVSQTATMFRDAFSQMIKSTSNRSIDGSITNEKNSATCDSGDTKDSSSEVKHTLVANTSNVAASVRSNISRWWQTSTSIIDKLSHPEHTNFKNDNVTGMESAANCNSIEAENKKELKGDIGSGVVLSEDPTITPEELSNVDNSQELKLEKS